MIIPTRKAQLGSAWLYGWFMCTFFGMFLQDLYGKEKYLAIVDEHWVQMSPAWGAMGLLFFGWMFMKLRGKYNQPMEKIS